VSEAILWHDLEYGAYAADLPLWRELAESAGGPVLELGSGTGRVALELGRAGHEVVGIEREAGLAAELKRRASERGLEVGVRVGELDSLELDRRFALAIAPMQVLQMLEAAERPAALELLREHLEPRARAAIAIVEPAALVSASEAQEPLPDIRELDGWVYSSRPMWIEMDGETMVAKRLRERVSPGGETERSLHEDRIAILDADRLEGEAARAGFAAADRRRIGNGPVEADSTVVILERRI
jgi:SAM-dependent methyltransferase